MKLDKLAKMHLLLRENGWEPEISPYGSSWEWRHTGNRTKVGNLRRRAAVFTTSEGQYRPWEFRSTWDKDGRRDYTNGYTVDSLEKKLREFALGRIVTREIEVTGPLADMHRILRENGWRSRQYDENVTHVWWQWSHQDHTLRISTNKNDNSWGAQWWLRRGHGPGDGPRPRSTMIYGNTKPEALATFIRRLPGRRLKELATS